MEFLESSRSAKKFNPSCTTRFRRPNPRGTSIILGCDKSFWETTNKRIQKQVIKGSVEQGKFVRGDRKMTSHRKRGMLESSLCFGNTPTQWKTESKQHYHHHDLRAWGPRSNAQRDSYSWTEEDRKKLSALRDASNADVTEKPHYMKLPPIYAKPGSQSNGHISNSGGDRYLKWSGKYVPDGNARYSQDENEDDI